LGDTHIGRVERKREAWGARHHDRAKWGEWGARIQKSRGTGKKNERQGEKGEGGEQEGDVKNEKIVTGRRKKYREYF